MNVLILGGSEFMGKSLVETLIEKKGYKIFMINRGKKYWNHTYKGSKEVHHYYGDRGCYIEMEKLIEYISVKHGFDEDNKWDMVIDFSSFERKEIKSIYRSLNKKRKMYVFISSDSVYDVCDPKIRREDFIKEIHSV